MTQDPQPPPYRECVIVFDGICILCSRCVHFVIRHDRRALFRFAALQTPAGAGLLHRHGIDPGAAHSFLLLKDGKAYLRSDAVIEIVRELDGGWSLLRVLRHAPRAWRDALYDFIAHRRYRWFGRRSRCMVPDPATRERFLEQAPPP